MSLICLEEDEYVKGLQLTERQAIWIAELTDGTKAYMDDNRPGIEIPSAWIRLKQHCQENNLGIKKFKLKFRRNELNLPDNADAYFFCKNAIRLLTSDATNFCYIVGALTKNVLAVQRWRIPELVMVESTVRNPEEQKPDCLIWTPTNG